MYWLPRSITICGTCEDAALSRYTSGLPWTVWLSTGKSLRMRSTSQTSTGLGLIVINCSKVAIFRDQLNRAFVSANLQIRSQPVQNRRVQLSLDRWDLDLLDHFLGKAVSQNVARELRPDAAAFEIKELVFLELADRRTMRTLHIIGENFELGLGIHLRIVGQQQILVRLLRVGQLRAMAHKHFAVEDRPRLAVENALVKLMAGAVRLPVINHRMRVGVLVTVNHVKPINPAFRAFMVHHHVDRVPRKRRTQIDRGRVVTRVCSQVGISRGDVKSARALSLHFEMFQLSARAKSDVGDRVR